MSESPVLSIVLPVHDEADTLPDTLARIRDTLQRLGRSFEMLAVVISDEGDGTTTALNFHGTQTEAVLDPAPPSCACP